MGALDFHPDRGKNEAAGCPVLDFLRVRRPPVPRNVGRCKTSGCRSSGLKRKGERQGNLLPVENHPRMVPSWGSPSPPLSKFLNRCLPECHTEMDPEALQRSGSSPRTRRPGTERDGRGPIRQVRRHLESDGGGRRSDPAQKGQTEDVVEPWRRRQSQANEKRSKASRNRFPNYQKIRKTPEPVGFNKYNSLACGKPTGSRFSPPVRARGNRFWEPVCIQAPRKCGNW